MLTENTKIYHISHNLYLLFTLSLVALVTVSGMFPKKFLPCRADMHGGMQMLVFSHGFWMN